MCVCIYIICMCICIFRYKYTTYLGFPDGLDGKESACKCRTPKIDPWVRKIP